MTTSAPSMTMSPAAPADGQEEREDALKGELEKLYQASDGKADGKSSKLRADGNAPVAEQRITKGQVHTSLVRAGRGRWILVCSPSWPADYNTARPHSGGYSSSTYFSRSAETKRLTVSGVVFCLYQMATIDCSRAGWRWINFTAGPNALRATLGIRATPRPEATAAAIPEKLSCSSAIRDGMRPRLLKSFSTHASYSGYSFRLYPRNGSSTNCSGLMVFNFESGCFDAKAMHSG
jgi:hypothetical protein